MSKVTLKNLTKTFGGITAVSNLDLEIEQGEFFSILGPSGCGKTTTLRMIAGFEFPTLGQIFFDDRDVTFLPPHRRNTGMVFQNYALFPHMTVFENVAFGLQARRVQKSAVKKRVDDALKLVDLSGFEKRKVTELSGGQQQRVAIARAIVIEPVILLLDEPLSNLDAKLREETRDELRALQRRLGITTVYVTHDQEEALALSDRMAVMKSGVCHQVGTPAEIYLRPVDRFVASFVGRSNILEGQIIDCGTGSAQLEIAPQWIMTLDVNGEHFSPRQRIAVSLRPECIRFVTGRDDTNTFDATIKRMSFAGAFADYQVEAAGHLLRVRRLAIEPGALKKIGDRVMLRVPPAEIISLLK
ncbi:MAG TPA: ABC transporter ATP-binding protein [bacterium]